MEHNAKAICKTVVSGKEKIGINKWLNLEFPYLFSTLCMFSANLILFQGLENRFHNSILRENPVAN